MKGPSLQKTAAFSTVLHITVVLAALIITRQSNHMSLPSPYIVNLIGPVSEPQELRNSDIADSVQPDASTVLVDKESAKKTKETKIAENNKNAAIDAIKAKKELEKRSQLQKARDAIQRRDTKPAATKFASSKSASFSKATPGTGNYEGKVQSEIEQYWHWPDTAEKNLEIKITVKIMRDGSITPIDVTKRSGNHFFDRMVINAIRKASPVTPPPYDYIGKEIDLEAVLTFYR